MFNVYVVENINISGKYKWIQYYAKNISQQNRNFVGSNKYCHILEYRLVQYCISHGDVCDIYDTYGRSLPSFSISRDETVVMTEPKLS